MRKIVILVNQSEVISYPFDHFCSIGQAHLRFFKSFVFAKKDEVIKKAADLKKKAAELKAKG